MPLTSFRPFVFGAVALASALTACAGPSDTSGAAKAEKPVRKAAPTELSLQPTNFTDLPDWSSDRASKAVIALSKSCAKVTRRRNADPIGKTTVGGTVADWKPFCAALAAHRPVDDATARRLLEQHMRPWRVDGRGTFTGYYEPIMNGSLMPRPGFTAPLYQRPDDAAAWMKAKGTGPVRAQLQGRDDLKPLLYLEDAAEAFVLHVQGSGVVRLRDGRLIRVAYAGNNGHRYKSPFPAMLAAGYDTSTGKTMQAMKHWLKENPAKAVTAINTNPRFIFFRTHEAESAVGAASVPLTPGRSMAVDTAHLPLGVPLYVDTNMYFRGKVIPLRRLMISQDVGSAIKGPVRGDIYWGTGDLAEELAGKMKEPGRYWLLLPKSVQPDSASVLTARPETARPANQTEAAAGS